mmetsp:Transcript_110381/g.330124  ORF Transcript_110381/g.330124 Transcript_110381/m.330124 type:complete len:243 (+) Transcript_110381:470-1198(+)
MEAEPLDSRSPAVRPGQCSHPAAGQAWVLLAAVPTALPEGPGARPPPPASMLERPSLRASAPAAASAAALGTRRLGGRGRALGTTQPASLEASPLGGAAPRVEQLLDQAALRQRICGAPRQGIGRCTKEKPAGKVAAATGATPPTSRGYKRGTSRRRRSRTQRRLLQRRMATRWVACLPLSCPSRAWIRSSSPRWPTPSHASPRHSAAAARGLLAAPAAPAPGPQQQPQPWRRLQLLPPWRA